MNNYDKHILIKKLIFQSKNRGWRENDLLLGRFAEKELEKFSLIDLAIYQQFLTEIDHDIFNWITEKVELPNNYKADIIYMLINFNKLNIKNH